MLSALWWCLATSYAIVFGNIPNFAQACESNWKLDRVFLYLCPCVCARVCVCARARVCFSGVWDLAITKPDLLGSDLLFFTSPTYQPPASVAVKRNGWYFRGELLFPFLAPVFFYFILLWQSANTPSLIRNVANKFRTTSPPRPCYVFFKAQFLVFVYILIFLCNGGKSCVLIRLYRSSLAKREKRVSRSCCFLRVADYM